jgi:hypothetical protein
MRHISYLLCVLSLALAASRGNAAGADPEYPWRRESRSCAEAPSRPGCPAVDWPSYAESMDKLQLLYRTEQFTLL